MCKWLLLMLCIIYSLQVYMNLQPLQVCMSYKHTLRIVDKVSEQHIWKYNFGGMKWKEYPKSAVSSTIMYTWSSLIKSYLGWQPSITSCIILEWLSRWCAIIRGCCFFVWGSRIQSSTWNWQPHWMLFWRRRSNGWGEWPCAGVSTRWFFLWCGYKFVGDNVDKNVKPSCQPQEIKGKSLHYCHAYAAKDRVNLALLSEYPPPKSAPDPNFTATISCGCVVAISLVYLLGICRVTCFAWPLKSSMCWTIILDKLKLT